MGAKGSAEAAAKLNADNWGHLEVCVRQQIIRFAKKSEFHRNDLQLLGLFQWTDLTMDRFWVTK